MFLILDLFVGFDNIRVGFIELEFFFIPLAWHFLVLNVFFIFLIDLLHNWLILYYCRVIVFLVYLLSHFLIICWLLWLIFFRPIVDDFSCKSPSFHVYKFCKISGNSDQTHADQSPSQLLSDIWSWLQSTQTKKNAQITAVHKFVEKSNNVVWGFIEWP
jgi:hypothetical protein